MMAPARYLLVAILIALVAYGGGRWQQSREDAAAYDAERTKAALSAAAAELKAVDRARLEEQRRTTAQTEIANAAIQKASAARDDARAADTARRELLARVDALVNASIRPGDPATVPSGAPARDPIVLLANVLGRADARAGELAQYADASRIAGQACERSYDSLEAATETTRAQSQ